MFTKLYRCVRDEKSLRVKNGYERTNSSLRASVVLNNRREESTISYYAFQAKNFMGKEGTKCSLHTFADEDWTPRNGASSFPPQLRLSQV